MEGRRGQFYERAGAMRDMLQSHMLQLMALVAMDPPSCLRCDDIRNEKVKLLRAIQPLEPEKVARWTVRGQYGPAGDEPGYRQEEGVDENSQVETFAALRLMIDNWRWAGVPFFLRTGKRLARKMTQITVFFRREPTSLFNMPGCDVRGPDRLVIRITPDEGIELGLDAKVPGPRMLIRPVKMGFSYHGAFGEGGPEAYESLLLDVIRGDQVLFVRDDEAEAMWRVIDSVRHAWDINDQPRLAQYEPLSWGPAEAQDILDDPYRHWQNS
jgi:glucose-6-phosphate 1-dehydrogenase